MKTLTIAEAAEKMGVTAQFLRVSLQRGKFDFGVAMQMSGKRYTYYINREKFERYLKQ